MAKAEAERIRKQREDLGPEGLANKGILLLNAMNTNNILPPNDMLTQVPIPTTESIQFHPLTKFKSNPLSNPPGINLELLPCFAEAYDIHTNFVYVTNLTLHISVSLFNDLIFSFPR